MALYVAAAVAEIAGCFAFRVRARLGRSALWLVEQTRPDRWDSMGALVCVGGAAIILSGPRSA